MNINKREGAIIVGNDEWIEYTNGSKVHKLAYVHSSAKLGKNTIVWMFANICKDVVTGEGCVIGSNVYVGSGVIMGNDCRIQDKAHITDRSVLRNRVFVGPCVVSCNDKYPKVNNKDYKAEPIIFEDDCSIGAGAVLLPGIVVCKFAIVGAGSVVIKDVYSYRMAFGNPAKICLRTDIEVPEEFKSLDKVGREVQ